MTIPSDHESLAEEPPCPKRRANRTLFALNTPIPDDLIARVVEFRVKQLRNSINPWPHHPVKPDSLKIPTLSG